jgi:hypothetical protein
MLAHEIDILWAPTPAELPAFGIGLSCAPVGYDNDDDDEETANNNE